MSLREELIKESFEQDGFSIETFFGIAKLDNTLGIEVGRKAILYLGILRSHLLFGRHFESKDKLYIKIYEKTDSKAENKKIPSL